MGKSNLQCIRSLSPLLAFPLLFSITTQKLKYILRHCSPWIHFPDFQQPWNCNPLGPQRVLLPQWLLFSLRLVPQAGDWLLLLPTAGSICGPCKWGKMKYLVKFLRIPFESHCQSKWGRDRLPWAMERKVWQRPWDLHTIALRKSQGGTFCGSSMLSHG